MQHIAIMKKGVGNISDIISGKKAIESRWYVNKVKPWNSIKKDDAVYFKESGGMVIAKALVKDVLQYDNLSKEIFYNIVNNYADDICMKDRTYSLYYQSKRYCILIMLDNVKKIEPFEIDKRGYGSASAWICIDNIERIKKPFNNGNLPL